VSGPHVFSVRKKAPSSEALLASTASCPALVTLANAPLVGQDGYEYSGDLYSEKQKYFLAKDWTGQISLISFEKLGSARNVG
jgi:hypothetical protein